MAEKLASAAQELILTEFHNIALDIYHHTEKLQDLASKAYNHTKIQTMPNPQNQVEEAIKVKLKSCKN